MLIFIGNRYDGFSSCSCIALQPANLVWGFRIFMWFTQGLAVLGGGREFVFHLQKSCTHGYIIGSSTRRLWEPLFTNCPAVGRPDFLGVLISSPSNTNSTCWSESCRRWCSLGVLRASLNVTLLYSHQETHTQALISHLRKLFLGIFSFSLWMSYINLFFFLQENSGPEAGCDLSCRALTDYGILLESLCSQRPHSGSKSQIGYPILSTWAGRRIKFVLIG